ncbi:hypothetical protein BSKO_01353 [Bryopsis sp. KO-2023]|nr:hypothetical protein BSKO_01353 [Bryopsis sp. KO-2023]
MPPSELVLDRTVLSLSDFSRGWVARPQHRLIRQQDTSSTLDSGIRIANNFLIANRRFYAGDVVMAVSPFLVEVKPRPMRKELHKKLIHFGRVRLVSTSWLFRLLAFAGADSTAKEKLLGLLPINADDRDDNETVRRAKETALKIETARSVDPCLDALRGIDRATIARCLVAWEASCLPFHNTTAIFDIAATFRHTCGEPHVLYVPPTNDNWNESRLVANRPIDEGEVLTLNLCWDWKWASTPARRRILDCQRLLACCCDRCTFDEDRSRGIRCRSCLKDGVDGYLYISMDKVMKNDPTPWACCLCGQVFQDNDTDLFAISFSNPKDLTVEQAMEDLVIHQVHMDQNEKHIFKSTEIERQYQCSMALLGPRHWTTQCFLLLHTKALAQEVETHAKKNLEILLIAQEIQTNCDLLWSFLVNDAKQDPLGALHPLFIHCADRLAHASQQTQDHQNRHAAASVAIRLVDRLQPIVDGHRPQLNADRVVERKLEEITNICERILQGDENPGLLRAVFARGCVNLSAVQFRDDGMPLSVGFGPKSSRLSNEMYLTDGVAEVGVTSRSVDSEWLEGVLPIKNSSGESKTKAKNSKKGKCVRKKKK